MRRAAPPSCPRADRSPGDDRCVARLLAAVHPVHVPIPRCERASDGLVDPTRSRSWFHSDPPPPARQAALSSCQRRAPGRPHGHDALPRAQSRGLAASNRTAGAPVGTRAATSYGGIEQVVATLATGLVERGHDRALLTSQLPVPGLHVTHARSTPSPPSSTRDRAPFPPAAPGDDQLGLDPSGRPVPLWRFPAASKRQEADRRTRRRRKPGFPTGHLSRCLHEPQTERPEGGHPGR